MVAVVFANGVPSGYDEELPPHDLLIAADGGARHVRKLGLVPDIVIGDLDSLSGEEIAGLERDGARILQHPVDKDETDLELALDFALRQSVHHVHVFAALGGRWDMTLANILLLAAPRYQDIQIQLVEAGSIFYILRAGKVLSLRGRPGDRVSTMALSAEVTGIIYQGLKWSLQNAALPFSSPRGVSNIMEQPQATLSISSGVLLCIHEKGSQHDGLDR